MKNIFLFLIPFFIVACSENSGVDVTSPSMQILSSSPVPAPGEICGSMEDTVFTVRGDETLLVELSFSDNASLSQYKVDIHNNFDCHGHGGSAAPGIPVPNVGSVTEDWTVLTLEDLSGETDAVTLSLKAPNNITAGAYHFQIQVLDESGNDNPLANFYSIRAFHPDDEEPPSISVDSPAETTLSAARGNTLRFTGQVSDNYSLSEGGNGLIFLSYTDLSSGNTFSTDAFVSFGGEVDTSYEFELEFVVPLTIKTGDYQLRLDAHDGVRNVAEPVFFELEVTD